MNWRRLGRAIADALAAVLLLILAIVLLAALARIGHTGVTHK